MPKRRLAEVSAIWVAFLILQVLKGGRTAPSIIGVRSCTSWFWVLIILQAPLSVGFTLFVARRLRREHAARMAEGSENEYGEGEVQWGNKELLYYPCFAFVAGMMAGLLGIGGGMVIGPMLLEMGIIPQVKHRRRLWLTPLAPRSTCSVLHYALQVSAATGALMVLFSSSVRTCPILPSLPPGSHSHPRCLVAVGCRWRWHSSSSCSFFPPAMVCKEGGAISVHAMLLPSDEIGIKMCFKTELISLMTHFPLRGVGWHHAACTAHFLCLTLPPCLWLLWQPWYMGRCVLSPALWVWWWCEGLSTATGAPPSSLWRLPSSLLSAVRSLLSRALLTSRNKCRAVPTWASNLCVWSSNHAAFHYTSGQEGDFSLILQF